MTLSRNIQDFVRREIAKALAHAGFVGGTLDAGRIGGAIPSQTHSLWSPTHNDVQVADTPAHGDVITWDASAGKWVAAPGGGGGGGSYVLISTQVLTSPVSSVTFTSIPGLYRHLVLVIHARGTTSATATGVLVRFNGDSGSNYDRQLLSGSGSTSFASASFAQTSALLGEIAAGNAPTNASGAIIAWIPDYRNTILHKSVTSQYKAKRGTSGNGMIIGYVSIEWRSTNAITSIDVICDGGNFVADSVFSLYGVN